MKTITATDFFSSFLKKIYYNEQYKDEVLKNYYSSKETNTLDENSTPKRGETPWTKLINRKIIPDILNEFLSPEPSKEKHTYTYQEFYKIDNTGWSYVDKENVSNEELKENFENTGMNWHLWNLEIAVEHENDEKDWFYEVVKLLPFDCALRVVVCYNDYEKRDNAQQGDKKKLEVLLNQIRCIDKGIEKLSHGEFLIIIGNCNGNTNTLEIKNMCNYKGYVFKNNCFTEL